MRNRLRVSCFLVVVGLWLSPGLAQAREIPFEVSVSRDSAFADTSFRKVRCDGPWFRTASVDAPMNSERLRFHSVNSEEFFSPFGDWNCTISETREINGTVYDTQMTVRAKFCLATDAVDVHFVIVGRGIQGGGTLPDSVTINTNACRPQSGLQALTQVAGSAEGVGAGDGHGSVSLSGTFRPNTSIALDQATVTVGGLLNEVDAAGELIGGIPVVLSANAGSTAEAATYTGPDGSDPQLQLEMRSAGTFTLSVDSATIALPQRCSAPPNSTTALALRITVQQPQRALLVLEGEVKWQCNGANPQAPTSLTVESLVDIIPPTTTPALTGTPTPPAATSSSDSGGCSVGHESGAQNVALLLLPLLLLPFRSKQR